MVPNYHCEFMRRSTRAWPPPWHILPTRLRHQWQTPGGNPCYLKMYLTCSCHCRLAAPFVPFRYLCLTMRTN